MHTTRARDLPAMNSDHDRSLSHLPTEVLLRILSHLQINDLLQASRTCHSIHTLACDPILHLERLHYASHTLSHALVHRPSKASISPPNAWIWLSKTNVLSRQISKSLIRIRLGHNLEHRPEPGDLVARAILPSSCTCYSSLVSPALIQSQQAIQRQRLKDGLGRKLERRPSVNSLVSMNIMPEECVRRRISPRVWEKRRQVIKESLKDGLRAWVEGTGVKVQMRKNEELEREERRTVKMLVRRFARGRGEGNGVEVEKLRARVRWGREVEMQRRWEERCGEPTRAHVSGMKKMWEGNIRAAAA